MFYIRFGVQRGAVGLRNAFNLNESVCPQHLTAVVAISLEEATSRKMAASAPSLTPSSEVPVLSAAHLLFCHLLALRTLLPSKSPLPPLPGAGGGGGRAPSPGRTAPLGRWREPRLAAGSGGARPAAAAGRLHSVGRAARTAGGSAAARGGMLGARCGPLPPTRRLLPFKHPGRGCACCRNLPFKSRLPPLPTPRPPPEPARRRHGLLDHLPPRGVSVGRPGRRDAQAAAQGPAPAGAPGGKWRPPPGAGLQWCRRSCPAGPTAP